MHAAVHLASTSPSAQLKQPPFQQVWKTREEVTERGAALAPRCTLPPPEIHLRSTYGGSSQETSSWAGSGGGEGRGKVPRAPRGGV